MVSLDELLGMRDAFVAFRVFAGIGCVFEYGCLQVVDTLACWRRWRVPRSVRILVFSCQTWCTVLPIYLWFRNAYLDARSLPERGTRIQVAPELLYL